MHVFCLQLAKLMSTEVETSEIKEDILTQREAKPPVT